jgi:transcriptional regulator with XRE-family HTH domain
LNRQHGWIGTAAYEAMVSVLVAARGNAGMTQHDLAGRLGVSQSMVAKIESRQRNVSLLEFLAIAKAIGDVAGGPDQKVRLAVEVAEAADQ